MLVHKEKGRIYHTMLCIQDPGNLEADLQAGGFAGYALLWLFLVCTIMVSTFNCNNLIWHFLLFNPLSARLAATATAMCYNAQCNALLRLTHALHTTVLFCRSSQLAPCFLLLHASPCLHHSDTCSLL